MCNGNTGGCREETPHKGCAGLSGHGTSYPDGVNAQTETLPHGEGRPETKKRRKTYPPTAIGSPSHNFVVGAARSPHGLPNRPTQDKRFRAAACRAAAMVAVFPHCGPS